jgi:hypothetical protein
MNLLENDSARMAARAALEWAGCEVVGIDGARNGLQIHIRRGAFASVLAHAARNGCTVADSHYFPAGSANVDPDFRHDGSYPGSRGFTCNALVIFPRDYGRTAADPGAFATVEPGAVSPTLDR